MTTEIEPYRPAREVDLIGRDDPLDGWIVTFGNVIKLSEYICETEFVPEAMRRKPAAVAGAIMSGREMGIPPMTALRHLHSIKGKIGQSAELMRAQVLRAGHEIRYIETTDQRCIVEGRRRDESEWTRVVFGVAQAKVAKIDLGGYPEDKLVARATSRLCRRKFADAVAGLPTVDELEDGYEEAAAPIRSAAERVDEPKSVEAPAPTANTVQRKRQPRKAAPARAAQRPAEATDEPDLPGDESPKDTETNIIDVNEQGQELCTRPQQTKLAILLDGEKLTDRQAKLDYLEGQFGRKFNSSKELTKDEASSLIDMLEKAQALDSERDAEQPPLDEGGDS